MSKSDVITLAHGNGGRLMRALIEEVIAEELDNPSLDVKSDAAIVDFESERLVMTTDGFTVQPLVFPGGSIGKLAVCGTVNDLAVAPAKPVYLSLNVIVEEGVTIELFQRVIHDVGESAREAEVRIVTGDTKVVPKGQAGGIYLVTTGVGIPSRGSGASDFGIETIVDGDRLLISGPIGDHGAAVMLAREEFGLSGNLRSDCANIFPLVNSISDLDGLRFLRDPTRGGLATVANEVSKCSGMNVILEESLVPIRPEVRSVCEILGFDPYYLACEGRVLAVASPEASDIILSHWRTLEQGAQAACIGEIAVNEIGNSLVRLTTNLGGERILDELEQEPLPRIC